MPEVLMKLKENLLFLTGSLARITPKAVRQEGFFMTKFTVAAFYKFISFEDYHAWQAPLKELGSRLGIKGIILLAAEGINATVSGTAEAIEGLLAFLRSDARLVDLTVKFSYAERQPFFRLKVRLKKEIVTLGVPGVSPHRQVGTYVKPQEWNQLLQDPDIILLDTRNDYEVEIGTFQGAVDPKTQSFSQFPEFVKRTCDPQKHKKVAMFCTGGIRCEKASSYMLAQGFEEVYHLEGGILKYLEEVSPEQSLWEGECFVFDQRVALTHGVREGHFDLCYGCRMPLSPQDKASSLFEAGVSCPKCHSDLTPDKAKSRRMRHEQWMQRA